MSVYDEIVEFAASVDPDDARMSDVVDPADRFQVRWIEPGHGGIKSVPTHQTVYASDVLGRTQEAADFFGKKYHYGVAIVDTVDEIIYWGSEITGYDDGDSDLEG